MTTKTEQKFTHLHNHTEYSMLDGISRIPDMVGRAVELGMDALAITDHGSLYGAVDFYSECKERGIKPIIGCETYVAHESRLNRGAEERSPHHLVLLARNNEGYRNLMQLITLAHLEGFHYRPRVDREILERHHEGLVILSGCASAELPRLLAEERSREAREVAAWYREIFGENYFLELQQHADVPALEGINRGLIELGKELDIPLVVTNDAHYVRQKDSRFQDFYICIQTNTNIQDEKRLRMEDDSYYLKGPDEMTALFPEHPEAALNTQRITEMCEIELGFGQIHLPRYNTPGGMDADEYLAQLCWEGFRGRYGASHPEAEKRMKYELEVIQHTKFANYFLVVWDIIDFTRKSRILFGVRGSAAASVALYCLGITDIDPLEYRLVFERFLHFERKEMPDIDMDFQDDRREEVMHYVIDRYGRDHVAQIITFGAMRSKAALRDVGRSMGMSYGDVDRIARMVPFKCRTIEDAIKANQDLADAYEKDDSARTLVDGAIGLEGIIHHVSTHPAGVLIADEPLRDMVPLQRPPKGDEDSPVMMTQYSMDPVAKLGLLKMDFLGLTALTILDQTVKLLDENRGITVDIARLPLDDEKTFELLASGKTTECFQLESSGMQRYIRELQPTTLGDIAAMIALYRPGPMEHIDSFIGAKHGRIPITYPHDSLKDVLDETYGVIVYQDQVLFILQSFAGYSLGEADTVRKAMGKKIASLMAEERQKFIKGAQGQGFGEEIATQIFDLIEPFAGYAFNKAHSVSYAMISYWTAYFKTHHHPEYMTAVLNARREHPDRMVTAINECFKLGLPVLSPDINRSDEMFAIDPESTAEQPALRAGLAAIKTVTETSVAPIVRERKANGPYRSLNDFCMRADVSALNRRTLESMIKAGALDGLGPRGGMLSVLDLIMSTAQAESKMRNSGQVSLFAAMGNDSGGDMQNIVVPDQDVDQKQKGQWERELVGISLSHNPLLELADQERGGAVWSLDQIDEEMAGQPATVLGQLNEVRERYTKERNKFLVLKLGLLGGAMEAIIWPDTLERMGEDDPRDWEEDAIVLVAGRLRDRGGQFSLSCEQVQLYTPGMKITAAPRLPAETGGQGRTRPARNDGGAQAAQRAARSRRENAKAEEREEEVILAADAGGTPIESPETEVPEAEVPEAEIPEAERETKALLTATTTAAETAAPLHGAPVRRLHQGGVVLRIRETEDSERDKEVLREAIAVLLDHPGPDATFLSIASMDGPVLMEMPMVSTQHSPEMSELLERILGQGSVVLEETAGLEQWALELDLGD